MALGPFVQSAAKKKAIRPGTGTAMKPKPNPAAKGVPKLAPPTSAGGAPGAAPAGNPVAAWGGLPWDPGVDLGVKNYEAQANMSLAELANAEAQLRLDIGLVQQPDGTFAVDVANPAGRAALMAEEYKRARRGDVTSMASRGILTSGAYQRQAAERNRTEALGMDQLGRALTQGLGQIQGQRDRATLARDQSIAALLYDYSGRVGADPANTPAQASAAGAGASGPGPGGRTITKASAAHGGQKWVYHYYPASGGKPARYVPIRPASR